MTESTGIRQDVLTPDYHPTAPSHSSFPKPASATVPYKRKILDRWTKRMGLCQRRGMSPFPAILVDQIFVSFYPHKILTRNR
jgi:hypothetical protein